MYTYQHVIRYLGDFATIIILLLIGLWSANAFAGEKLEISLLGGAGVSDTKEGAFQVGVTPSFLSKNVAVHYTRFASTNMFSSVFQFDAGPVGLGLGAAYVAEDTNNLSKKWNAYAEFAITIKKASCKYAHISGLFVDDGGENVVMCGLKFSI